ncbi:MAG: hypothetical protein QM790_18665 [Nibricoccus sp.]
MINEEFVRQYFPENPLGHTLTAFGSAFRTIASVGNVRNRRHKSTFRALAFDRQFTETRLLPNAAFLPGLKIA